jgi:hypothetical protein
MSDRKTFLEKIHSHLFAEDKVSSREFTKPEQEMLLRYRAIFTKWLADWSLSDKEMVNWLKSEYFGISQSVAYHDINQVKILLGNVMQAGKEFQRFRASEMIMKAYTLANDAETPLEVKRAEAIIKAAAALVKVHKLNHKDDNILPYDDIVPPTFEVTGDVSVLGLEPIPNLKEVQRKLREKYNKITGRTEDAEYEVVK